ncbi:Rieske (2Fe-2S) protein [Natronobiforma cellulositropha]|uniref:Rieske (2Fe-2S) protein n=1 Tax=Natronobiforma cellulositropha TaxID=1679076 RepID=UPI0021D5F0AE|nr:Rieske 2Fe-2S domain-containing protein [Natronobiforma cellulositropha]
MSETITLQPFEAGERRFVKASGVEIAVVNVDGEYYAFKNWCPHMGAPLGRGPVESAGNDECETATVSCPFHSWCFDLESGKSTFSELQIATFDVTREGDDLHLHVA